MLVARRLVLGGRVQGVGFRYFAVEAANREGIGGWVQNLDDGRVEIFAEGDREAVDRFEAKIRRGPAGARVQHVTSDDDLPSGRSGTFTVRP